MKVGYTIYCDELSDQILAEQWLKGGRLSAATIRRLPALANAPDELKSLLEWERQDWVIVEDGRVRCTVEFSRHGYTGDNGFQRFARLYRAASLRIPNIYFTPFSRTRTNELDIGVQSARNVAPELFQTLFLMSEEFGIPCLAVPWPTDGTGTPLPMTEEPVERALEQLRAVIDRLLEAEPIGSNTAVAKLFPQTIELMKRQAELPFRGTETRRELQLPVAIEQSDWILNLLPGRYFSYGKADKALASLAIRTRRERPVIGVSDPFWERPGKAWVLFLGYQWRPDPASGLIALAAARARRFNMPLIVVWPRVFRVDGPERRAVTGALAQFSSAGTGPLADELRRLNVSGASIERFRTRVNVADNQFGVYAMNSKPGRILSATARLVVLGDSIIAL